MSIKARKEYQSFGPESHGGLSVSQIGIVENPDRLLALAEELTHGKEEILLSRTIGASASSWYMLKRKTHPFLHELIDSIHTAEREIFGRFKSFSLTSDINFGLCYYPKATTAVYDDDFWPCGNSYSVEGFLDSLVEERPKFGHTYFIGYPSKPAYVLGHGMHPVRHKLGFLHEPYTQTILPYNQNLNRLIEQDELFVVQPASVGAIMLHTADTIYKKLSDPDTIVGHPYFWMTINVSDDDSDRPFWKVPLRRLTRFDGKIYGKLNKLLCTPNAF